MPQISATGGNNVTLSGSVIADIQSKDTFTVTGATVGTTETSIVIPSGAKAWKIQAASSAGAAVLTISHTVGGTSVATTSFDICPGNSYDEEYLKGTNPLTIYIKSSKAGTPVQVLYWS